MLPGSRRAAPAQLLSVASLLNLEQRYQAAGLDSRAVADDRMTAWIEMEDGGKQQP